MPLPHPVHTPAPAAPSTSLYRPGLHTVHTAVPVVSALYVPRAHDVHHPGVVAVMKLE